MEIGFFNAADTEALVDAFHELNRHYFGENAASRAVMREHVLRDILGPESGVRIVVAKEGSEVAGLATISLLYPAPEAKGQLFLKDLYTCANWRGRGVGEDIMRFLAAYAVSKNCIRLDWTTESTNAGALAFYERLGAKRVEEKVYLRLTGDALVLFAAGKYAD